MSGPVFPTIDDSPITRTQRWAQALVLLTTVGLLILGFFLKDQILTSTEPFRDLAAGILARYPSGWLLDHEGAYVFRVRDPKAPAFRTTFQVAVEPIGQDAAARNILDNLTLRRAQTLAAYHVLSTVDYALPEGDPATRMEYVFVQTEANPFLQSVPVVVRGVDIVTVKRGQAIVVTFRVEADRFDDEIWRLDQFLATLEF